MPNVNLIAAHRDERKKIERIAGQLFIALGTSVGIFVLLGFYLAARHLSLNADMAAAEARMQKLRPILSEINRIDSERSSLLPKVETLENAKIDTLRWRAVFQLVAQSTPSDTWLSQLSSTEGEEPKITLTGLTSSQTQVGQLMTNLQAHPLFAKVDLSYNQTLPPSPNDNVQRVQFEVVTILRSLRPKEAPKDGTAPGSKTAQAAQAGGNSNG
jgi:Tfp pilus assembly protein PilN